MARKNNALLIVADGVNWGEKSKIAARCAISAAVNHIHSSIFVDMNKLISTKVNILFRINKIPCGNWFYHNSDDAM